MRGIVIAGWMGILLLPHVLRADVIGEPTTDKSWDQIRTAQPSALHLKMTLAKDHFFQGERIEADLEFSNDDPNTSWSVAVGAGTPGAIFRAIDASGRQLVEPMQWFYNWYPIVIEGPIANHPFGKYALKLPVNATVRFDAPGIYSLYAFTTVTEGTAIDGKPRADLVSDLVRITLVPIKPDEEKAIIAEALDKIAKAAPNSWPGPRDGFEELSYLQTRASRDQLIGFLGKPDLEYWVRDGLLGAPDPEAEADRIMASVKAAKLVPSDSGAELYDELKTAGMLRGSSPQGMPEQEASRRYEDMRKAGAVAKQELLAAAIAAAGDHGPATVEALWSAFEDQAVHKNPGEPDHDGGKARAALAAHQLELSPAHVKRLFDAWPYWGSADFLPLVRRELKSPANHLTALIALAGFKPDEARPLVIAELSNPSSPIFEGAYQASELLPGIPPMPMPQFDATFREQLDRWGERGFPTIPLINAFGSPALLPDVLRAWNAFGHDEVHGASRTVKWDDQIKTCFFRYWLRCDPKAGAIALEKEIESREKEGAGFFAFVLRPGWSDDLKPIVDWALDNPETIYVNQGVYALEKRGNDGDIDRVISAIERTRGNVADPKFSSREAAELLKTAHWHYTDAQRKRLGELALESPEK
jgi:hypothetical protein